MVQWIWPILQNLGFKAADSPIPTYEDSKNTIDIIKPNQLKIQVNHINVTIHYVHEQYYLLTVYHIKVKTTT